MRSAVPFFFGLVLACDAPAKAPSKSASEEASAPAAAKSPTPAPEPAALPPAPDGAVIIDRVYVQTCAQPEACPDLMQKPGAEHCAGLQLGGLSWRLPTLEQLQSWRGNADLKRFDVMHWSGSVWKEDAGQVWIYDPGSNAKTTAKPDRKPFVIRCVAEPA
ncbi:MAG: hypothetical protein AAF799_07825 [Myxococcota bacterium]